MFPGVMVVLEPGAHIGHGAMVHGARIGANALIGMNAVIMDNAVVGARLCGRRALLRADGHGDPAAQGGGRESGEDREGRDRRDAGLEDVGHALYQALPAAMRASLEAGRTAARAAAPTDPRSRAYSRTGRRPARVRAAILITLSRWTRMLTLHELRPGRMGRRARARPPI